MRRDSVRTSLDLPRELHRKLHEHTARTGDSARQLILRSIERTLAESPPRRRRRRLRLDPPIVPTTGKPINLTSEQIHAFLELP
jgi:hypothetical protein